nr:MAG TPA: hypothetical protein [Caudoviricetes sp.]
MLFHLSSSSPTSSIPLRTTPLRVDCSLAA